MKERYELSLQTLDSQYEEERRRQLLLMQKRLKQRQMKAEKMAQMKALVDVQDVDKKGMIMVKQKVDYEMLAIDEKRDDQLARQLREWIRVRRMFKEGEEKRRLAETVIELEPSHLKSLIIKLDNLEKGLKELRRMEVLKQKLPNLQRRAS
jgi:hypothetical protein